MTTRRLRYIHEDVDRYGNVRVYFWRRPGRKVRIREPMGSAAFHATYAKLLAEGPPEIAAGSSLAPGAGTWGWLVARYQASRAFATLDQRTRYVRRLILEGTCPEPRAPGAPETFRDCPLPRFDARAVRVLRDRKTAPEAANSRVKAIRAVLAWAAEQQIAGVQAGAARDVAYIRTGSTGWHSWTVEEVAAYEARHPTGTMARLALDLLLYTGARRSDVVLLGPAHARDDWLRWTARKNSARRPVVVEVPVLPELARAIEATAALRPEGAATFLVSERGQPFGTNYFGNWFRRRCDEAGLPGKCSAHGLRKAGAALAAERGATEHQLMAIFGWTTAKQAQHYTRAARRRIMAGAAAHLLSRVPDVPTDPPE